MILAVLEHLGFEPPLGAVGLVAEFQLKVNWKEPEPLVGQGSRVPASCWLQLLQVVLEQMLCPPHLWSFSKDNLALFSKPLGFGSFNKELHF